ncbi:sec-independent translocase [Nocardioides sp. STR2]|jgi:sec-independent protein translocase protein TatB|uniref:Sec-independent translocase n=1 Tax=Nocardioides pini TaxID=2975053 RepID=A0ABT4C902_9ACTN|nr:sec-independent translocase [Nocardioides pini]MCY4725437.1 sec-independent translocase [Nocardioides pini]
MFDVGLLELAVIALVAVIVLGPDKLPDLARQAAQLLHRARGLAHNARDELRNELGPDYADLELRDLDPRSIVRKHITEAMAEVDREQAQAALQSRLPDGQVPPYDVEAT